MRVFVVYCHDRHVDPGISVHQTRAGADRHIEEFMASYSDDGYTWTEENFGRASGWVRYVDSRIGDGPNARIQEVELLP